MNTELTIYKLGNVLKRIEKDYGMELFTKINLSGGWLTINGRASIESVPEGVSLNGNIKGNNIISININNNDNVGSSVKIIGEKGKSFSVNVSPTKYMEFNKGKMNTDEIKENLNECKLRIDEDIIFKIPASDEDIIKIING